MFLRCSIFVLYVSMFCVCIGASQILFIFKCSKDKTFLCFCQRSGNAVLGLPYALASLSFCQSFNLDLLKASATLALAELWLSLGSTHAKRALSLIQGALPMILGHGGLELRARAYIAEAKCYLSDPSFSGTNHYILHTKYSFACLYTSHKILIIMVLLINLQCGAIFCSLWMPIFVFAFALFFI